MARINGGIIGPDNVPSGPLGSASGVWKLSDAFNYQKAGLWPVVTGITYPVANSLRFNSGSSDSLTKNLSTATDLKTWTWSAWIKRSKLSTEQGLFSGDAASTYTTSFFFDTSDRLQYKDVSAGSTRQQLITNKLFRDISSWYNIQVVYNSTEGTASNRLKFYVNGSQETSFSTATYPSLNETTQINSSDPTGIGKQPQSTSNNFNGYMSDVYFIDGQALTPTSFGETDSVSENWKAKAYSGSYGTNGFFLQFNNSGALGTDSSGNTNTFTVNNLTSVDQSTDTPTTVYATWNPLDFTGTLTASQGNTVFQGGRYRATLGMTSGKWYWEAKRLNAPGNTYYGIKADSGDWSSTWSESYTVYTSNGEWYLDGSSQGAYGTSSTTNDILMFALDMDNGKFYIGKNGTWFNSGDPATSTNPMTTGISGTYLPTIINNTAAGTDQWSCNFGSPSYAANGYADGNGFGDFSYAVPTGYYALNTQNLNFQG